MDDSLFPGARIRLALLFLALGAVLSAPGRASAAASVLVDAEDSMVYLANSSDPGIGLSWTLASFDSSRWTGGFYGVGYDSGTLTRNLIRTTVPTGTLSVYTRATFTVANAGEVTSLFLGADHDDGYIAWINGVEVSRGHMPAGNPTWNTHAIEHESSNAPRPNYSPLTDISAAGLPAVKSGVNVLAIGVWNTNSSSNDLVLVPRLSTSPTIVTRGPYLQMATPTSVVVRWRTDVAEDSRVLYGPAPGSLLSSAGNMALTTEHVVKVTGLAAGTRYHYAVGGAAGAIAGGDATHSFLTPPAVGTSKPTRIWVLGDSGTKNSAARAVRDAYAAFTGTVHTDLWLMLGDNAYPDGLDSNYQAAVFDMYPFVLRKSVLWPTLGNHDGRSADSATQSGPYYDIFTLPAAGEAGGLESGTEAYYSFDHANIHFICLDSTESSRSPTGAMLTWLGQDVASTQQDWVIAFWHHPPYSKGSHDSDTEGQLIQMRQNALPILEAAGVDLVLSGHSHSYERSFLLDGHYGASTTFSETMKVDGGNGRSDGTGPYRKASSGQAPHEGAVYVVVGSSGKVSGGLLNHPAMYISLNLLGSMVLDVNGTRLDAQFLGSDGARLEYFTIQKPPRTLPAPSNLGAAAISQSEVALAWRDNSTDEDGFRIERSLNAASWTQVTQVGRNVTGYTDVGLAPKTTYYYRVRAFRGTVNSSYSDTASATTPGAPIVQVAHDEVTVAGTRYRRFGKTLVADGVYESIEEIRTSGATALMKSYLEHKWKINVAPGSAMTFHVKGYQSPSTDNDHFVFAYSSDGSSYTDILTLSRTVDDGTYLTGALPNTLSGEIIIRVQDTDRTPGNRRIDTVFIDHLYIVTE